MIYVDLDGVLADFDARATLLFGKHPRQAEREDGSEWFWQTIAKEHYFYLTLPRMADASLLWDGVLFFEPKPIILTGVPSSMPWAADHKKAWCADQFPGTQVITCFSRDKAKYCKPRDILIDDWEKYKDLWEQAGGRFITHTSAQRSLDELRSYGV